MICFTVLRYDAWHMWLLFSFWAVFALLPPNFCLFTQKKRKKTPGDIIILHKCTKNHDHMLQCSWDMACDGRNCYFSFWAIFCSITPVTAQKMKISKKWKKCLVISSFYTIVPKIMIICYTASDIRCMTGVIIFHLGLFC